MVSCGSEILIEESGGNQVVLRFKGNSSKKFTSFSGDSVFLFSNNAYFTVLIICLYVQNYFAEFLTIKHVNLRLSRPICVCLFSAVSGLNLCFVMMS